MMLFHTLYIFVIVLVSSAHTQEVIGCGGFIKSDVEINFSFIEVKLLTKQGALKYQTDCAPINGYYMIPVYDAGEYVLVVEPPPGWSFEPQQIEIDIDGSTDMCSKGEDINFQFMGFGVAGRVVSFGQKTGPSGVRLDLKKPGSNDIIQTSSSSTDGSYLFSQVLPGEYEIHASHPSWFLQPDKASVTVSTETGHAGTSITVAGYDVTGLVMSEGEPTSQVQLLLYSKDVKTVSAQACNTKAVASLPKHEGLTPLCHTVSSETGAFVFPALPTGSYTVVPVYTGKNIKFDLEPAQQSFQVGHASVKLEREFQVAGFSVSGQVLNAPTDNKGSGVASAIVQVNDRKVLTGKDGSFILESMKAGSYAIQVTADGMSFDPVTVKITPNTPQLPAIVASRFAVCGSVTIDQFPPRVSSDLSKRRVTATAKGAGKTESHTIEINADGKFCTDLAAGTYTFKADVSAHEIHAGLILAPLELDVTVTHAPVRYVAFRQVRLGVSGRVTCLEACKPLQLKLAAVDRPEDSVLAQAAVNGKTAQFSFKNVLPGKYKISVLNEDWCWQANSQEVTVHDKDVSDVTFTHNGYYLTCTLSHDVTLVFSHEGSQKEAGSFSLSKGTNKFCLEKPGVYILKPQSCHQFEQESYRFDTAAPSVLTLDAVRHLVQGRVTSELNVADIMVYIHSSLQTEEVVLGPLKSLTDAKAKDSISAKKGEKGDKKKEAATVDFEFTYWARAGETVRFTPQSETMLFYPEQKTFTVDGLTCPGLAASFQAKKGIFISGQVTPALEGVAITVTGGEMAPIDVNTDNIGAFRVGPLHPGVDYSVTAVKEGYVLTPVQGKQGHFSALRLCEMRLRVADETSDQPLGGVLLSISGIDYRSNALTSEAGELVLNSLAPGQYFVKPMMKEYVFEPAAQTLSVQQGETVQLKIKGRRVAYSCHGSVTSLNGEQEQGVVVVALGQGDCAHFQEEAKSEADGSFHLRGLQPSCVYYVQLKPDFNLHIERAAPEFISVQVTNEDVSGLLIIAFRRMSRLDLSGSVRCQREFLQYLRVALYRDAAPDSPLQTITLGQSPFFYLASLPLDNQLYFVRLESTLSRTQYDYILPELSFVANKTFQHFSLDFSPERRSLEQELSHSSFLLVPLIILLVLAAYNQPLVMPYLMAALRQLVELVSSLARLRPPSAGSGMGGAGDAGDSAAQAHYRDQQLLAELAQMNKKKPKRA